MFTLKTERGKYLRVRRGVSQEDVIGQFSCPVNGLFCGAILSLGKPTRYCYARVGDSYEKIARREGVDEDKLRSLNGGAVIYPTLRIWLP